MKADTTEIKYAYLFFIHSNSWYKCFSVNIQSIMQLFSYKGTTKYKSWSFCSTVNRIFHEKQISVQYSTKNILQLFLYNKHSNEYIFILGVCTTIEIFCAHFDDRLSSKKIHSYNHFFAGMYMSSLLLDGWILQQ